MDDQSEYRPPTQSQIRKRCSWAMPNLSMAARIDRHRHEVPGHGRLAQLAREPGPGGVRIQCASPR